MKKLLKTKSKWWVLRCGALTVLLLIMCGMAFAAEGMSGWRFPLAVVLSAIAGLVMLCMKPIGKWLSILTAAVIPFLAWCLLEFFTHVPWDISVPMTLLNCIFFYTFYLLLAFLCGSIHLGYWIASLFVMILGTANYFVIDFRSSPIVPWDLFSVGTAASVADNYTYTVTWRLAYVIFGFVFLLLLCRSSSLKMKNWKIRIPAAVVVCMLLLGTVAAIQKKETKDFFGMDQTLFTPNVRYRNNGFAAAFLGNLYLIQVQKPEGYSSQKVEAFCQEIENSPEQKASVQTAEKLSEKTAVKPNIIVVMDEAFSDLAMLGNFQVSEDYMPFVHSMIEEQNGGHLMVSVKGGNTANTEYEFLSGDSMAFLPAGSVVYQQYIRDDIPSIPAYLKELGYSTTAIHPYLASGWDRDKVYPKFGFDEFLSIDDFKDPKYIRKYVSDESAFDKIIEVFENKEPDQPAFIFEVTMQNHSGYSKDFPGFTETVLLPDAPANATSTHAAEKYLTLIKDSDTAFQNLIEYFEKVEEPTVIIMFGDHQPSDYITHVISALTGYDPEASLEELQKNYIVPYVIWNNFGADNSLMPELTSVNYLGGNLLSFAGLPLTPYQTFLKELQKTFPVLCAGTYIDADGVYHSWDDEGMDADQQINEYHMMSYNHLTDAKHMVENLFTGKENAK